MPILVDVLLFAVVALIAYERGRAIGRIEGQLTEARKHLQTIADSMARHAKTIEMLSSLVQTLKTVFKINA